MPQPLTIPLVNKVPLMTQYLSTCNFIPQKWSNYELVKHNEIDD